MDSECTEVRQAIGQALAVTRAFLPHFPPFFRSLASFKYSFSLSLSAGSSLRPFDLSAAFLEEGPPLPLVDLDLAKAADEPAFERPLLEEEEADLPLAEGFFLFFFLLSPSSLSELKPRWV